MLEIGDKVRIGISFGEILEYIAKGSEGVISEICNYNVYPYRVRFDNSEYPDTFFNDDELEKL